MVRPSQALAERLGCAENRYEDEGGKMPSLLATQDRLRGVVQADPHILGSEANLQEEKMRAWAARRRGEAEGGEEVVGADVFGGTRTQRLL